MRDRAWLLVVALAAGCVEPQSVDCGDGTRCPADHVCRPDRKCVRPDQLSACDGLIDGQPCDIGLGAAECRDGVCELFTCGDGVVGLDEACDDGNRESGDGCRSDCAKDEICGDAMLDDGEACDDGNANNADSCTNLCRRTEWIAKALIGGNAIATATSLLQPRGVAFDAAGNLYIADQNDHRVRRVQAITGITTIVAGTGFSGRTGDGGPAASAQLARPNAVAVDGIGHIYIADTSNHRIRKVHATTGVITTVAGSDAGFEGDGGPATGAKLSSPAGVTVDGLGNLYIADTLNHRVRRVDQATGVITTVAGAGPGYGGDGGLSILALLQEPTAIALDAIGNLYIADSLNHRVRKVSIDDAKISTFAGNGIPAYSGDGGLSTASGLRTPTGVAVDGAGNVYIAELGEHRIRQVSNGIITTVVGTGQPGFAGDGMAAVDAKLFNPSGVAIDPMGTMYIADSTSRRIRRVVAGVITTVAGRSKTTLPGDDGPGTSADLSNPSGVCFDAQNNLFIADSLAHSIRKVDATTGDITTFAGIGIAAYSGDLGPAELAGFQKPSACAFDANGNLFVADMLNQRVRRIDASTGVVTTVAGISVMNLPSPGYNGDGIAAVSAKLNDPRGLAFDAAGDLYIADVSNHRVRKITMSATTPIITTVAGTGAAAFTGDGGAATAATLDHPTDVAVDSSGNLLIADSDNHRIRRVTGGTIQTVAGNGTPMFSGDGGLATSASLNSPNAVMAGPAGSFWISDSSNARVRRVAGTPGTISTLSGTGQVAFSGDGGPAASAFHNEPYDLAIDTAGNIIVADHDSDHVRRIAPGGTNTITTIAGEVDSDGTGALARARLSDPQALVVTAPFPLFAAGSSGAVQAVRNDRLGVVAGRYRQGINTAGLARFRSTGFGAVNGIAYDPASGRIFISESSNSNRVYIVTPVVLADEKTWTIVTLAGANAAGAIDGPIGTGRLRDPGGLWLDAAAQLLYVADTGNHSIRSIDLSPGSLGYLRTVAGTPATLGFGGDGQAALGALLQRPRAITQCRGDLFIADTANHRVRRIHAGTITTVLGDGSATSSGQGAPASMFPVNAPLGLACDADGNLFVSSSSTIRMLPANAMGVVDGTGPVQTIFGAPPHDTFLESVTFCLTGLAVVDATTLQVTDSCSGMLIELKRQLVP